MPTRLRSFRQYYLYDLNGKINYRINKNNRIYLSGYNGGDKASAGSSSEIESDGVRSSDTRAVDLGLGETLSLLYDGITSSGRNYSPTLQQHTASIDSTRLRRSLT
ncbi:MAG: hypothetical protein WDO14_07785 [Bacteroidota bacterium]